MTGTSTGQGNYLVRGTANNIPGAARLAGTGLIGLATDMGVTVSGGSRVEPGGGSGISPLFNSTIGALHFSLSGTGAVAFSNGGVLSIQVGSAGVSDLLAISGGKLDLTSASDVLAFGTLGNAFDGSTYTIATFDQHAGAFDSVTGLPANYFVSYQADRIMLLPAIPEPATALLSFGGIGMLLSIFRPVGRHRA
jgi:hypothetical protein